MNAPTKKLLQYLSDNRWHLEKLQGVGITTVETCIDQGMVVTMRTQRKRSGKLVFTNASVRLSKKGRAALQEIPPW